MRLNRPTHFRIAHAVVAFVSVGLPIGVLQACSGNYRTGDGGVDGEDSGIDGSFMDGSVSDAHAEVSSEAAADASDAVVCTQSGTAACNDVLDAYCNRVVQCCSGGCTSNGCVGWMCSVIQCRANFNNAGKDCTTTKYSSKTVCQAKTNTCVNGISTGITCNIAKAQQDGCSICAGCYGFWDQFP